MISRRRLLLTALSGVAAASAVAVHRRHRREFGRAAAEITGMISARRLVVEIGEEYLRLFPHERDVDALVARIRNGGKGPTSTTTPLKDELDRYVRDDFTSGDTVRIRGWLLSRTEARVYALIALE